MKKTIIALIPAVMLSLGISITNASEGDKPPAEKWSWTGYFGSFDQASAQRGLQVYTEVCASCHGLKYVAYRNLSALGYNAAEIKAYAAEFEVEDGPNSEGEMYTRPAKPSDRFVSPFANDEASIAANGALPPDLSLIVKSRASGHGNIATNFLQWMGGRGTASGADYVYHLLIGYLEEDEATAYMLKKWDEKKAKGELTPSQLEQGFSLEIPEGKAFNKWLPGHNIAMANPIDDDLVEYEDGTKATKKQIAHDVTTFLAWASEPELEQRKRMAIAVLGFLIIMLGLFAAVKKRLWAGIKP